MEKLAPKKIHEFWNYVNENGIKMFKSIVSDDEELILVLHRMYGIHMLSIQIQLYSTGKREKFFGETSSKLFRQN